MNIFSFTFEQLSAELGRRYGKGNFHAAAFMRWFYHHRDLNIADLSEFKSSPALAAKLENEICAPAGRVSAQKRSGELTKILTRLSDGLEIESVVVPMATHKTLCVSSQVGCRMGCTFCETGRMGLRRNLSAAEIVAQVYTAKIILGYKIRNLVFMGMGEPFDNFEAVIQAIKVLSDQRGLDIAKRHITVSTAGRMDGVRRLAKLNWPRLNLAISLNAPNDNIRTRLMPINRIYSMAAISKTFSAYPLHKKGLFFIEYVLIKDVNDQHQHALELAAYLKPLKYRLNVIPYNPAGNKKDLAAPDQAGLDRFCGWLVDETVFVRKRTTKGSNLSAACGQLSTGNQKSAV
jgi:23S rRNA (adenine2503-C2)-methyltransferase